MLGAALLSAMAGPVLAIAGVKAAAPIDTATPTPSEREAIRLTVREIALATAGDISPAVLGEAVTVMVFLFSVAESTVRRRRFRWRCLTGSSPATMTRIRATWDASSWCHRWPSGTTGFQSEGSHAAESS